MGTCSAQGLLGRLHGLTGTQICRSLWLAERNEEQRALHQQPATMDFGEGQSKRKTDDGGRRNRF